MLENIAPSSITFATVISWLIDVLIFAYIIWFMYKKRFLDKNAKYPLWVDLLFLVFVIIVFYVFSFSAFMMLLVFGFFAWVFWTEYKEYKERFPKRK